MATVVHFEIPADDVGRARTFYTELFGWKVEEFAGGGYWMITTSGEKPVEGGMMARRHPRQTITNYIDVASVDQDSARVESLGGRVVVPKMAVKGMGYFAVCLDTEGNHFGLWEDDPGAE
ncbi:MAG: glyoxalase [Desulfuromonas sp.]|uniref:VOC family protein n=1 Tax=Desulfuromonas sp. TaxID=892 RepID=UPI000CC1E1BF|nr:VOC family protein [Desulfuromonas sp.]PLX86701.1 MAG: glyoxalase [Desulfuromonas sp.]